MMSLFATVDSKLLYRSEAGLCDAVRVGPEAALSKDQQKGPVGYRPRPPSLFILPTCWQVGNQCKAQVLGGRKVK